MRTVILLIFLSCAFIPTISFGQDPFARKYAFEKRDFDFNGGVSFGYYRNDRNQYGPKAGSAVPLTLSAEYGISDRIGIGFITGVYSRKFKVENNLYDPLDNNVLRDTRMIGGLRVNLHFTSMLENFFNTPLSSDEIDFYLGASGTVEKDVISSTKYQKDLHFHPGIVGGARYYFLQNVGIFAEGGTGNFGLLTLGLSGRL